MKISGKTVGVSRRVKDGGIDDTMSDFKVLFLIDLK